MAEPLPEILLDKRDMVETVMEVFDKGAEAVDSSAEDFSVFSISLPLVQLALDNTESTEAEYMKEQFQKVWEHLEVMSEEVERINQQIRKSEVDVAYFQVEENLNNVFRKYMDILNAKPKFRAVKKKLFLKHFEKTGGDLNLDAIYGAVTGSSGEPLLETVLAIEQRSRRAVEEFCSGLKKLFIMGIIAVMGHAALNQGEVGEELVSKWQERMGEVERRMKAAVDDCKETFAVQAKMDVEHHLLDKEGSVNRKLI
ncbi:rapunzel 4 isoform X2 [Paramormyrops kingsleyae]|uniref:rapunzel 4 isoform X2 n=1 Tax=Paramormyrops kingsleyae TaxID=1676925 RepID=UPI003B9792AC